MIDINALFQKVEAWPYNKVCLFTQFEEMDCPVVEGAQALGFAGPGEMLQWQDAVPPMEKEKILDKIREFLPVT